MIDTTFSNTIDKLAPALVQAQAAMLAVPKSGENTFDRYKYADLEDYVRRIRPVLREHELAVVAGIADVDQLPDRETKSGKAEHAVTVEMDVWLIHTSGQWMRIRCAGTGQDRSDKDIYKAITGCRKYALSAMFNLATSDDPEKPDAGGGGGNGNGASKPPDERLAEIRRLILLSINADPENPTKAARAEAATVCPIVTGYDRTADIPADKLDAVLRKLRVARQEAILAGKPTDAEDTGP